MAPAWIIGIDEIAGELLLEVVDVDFRCAGLLGLGVEPFQFVVLADVGAEGDDFGLVGVFDPGKEDGGVETTGVGEDDFPGPGSLPMLDSRSTSLRLAEPRSAPVGRGNRPVPKPRAYFSRK
jgi:hypothetical protein